MALSDQLNATYDLREDRLATFFSDRFGLDTDILDDYGAFNVSIINDLPLFIDPFLLFNSEKDEYQKLHDEIIRYLVFLKDKAASGSASEARLRLWYCFPEVKQNWLGFSLSGNSGSGLGIKFARALHANLHKIFHDFGSEQITEGSHLEKVCLISEGVGRDNISDFTTNLIKDFLCRYTHEFARKHISDADARTVAINNVKFNYETGIWSRGLYRLPWCNGDYILLTPKDILTRDDNWINRRDLIENFERIPTAIPDAQLREQVFQYFESVLICEVDREPNKQERGEAAASTMLAFPQLIDYYIKLKEDEGEEAENISADKVLATEYVFIHQLKELQKALNSLTDFYRLGRNTYEESHTRLAFLKDVIENKGGHRIFYHNGKPIEREKDLQILYRLVWYGSPSDVGTEADDGRGPVDFKISRSKDKTLIEMKLAKNSALQRNLERQVEIYQRASDASNAIKCIIFFTYEEQQKVHRILKKLGISGHKDIVLIDARSDNKPSGSKA